jgi:hypothetical protein
VTRAHGSLPHAVTDPLCAFARMDVRMGVCVRGRSRWSIRRVRSCHASVL